MNERPTDNPIDAVRGPALAGERAREADDITAMVLAYDAAPAESAPRGVRRRGALVAAAAIASLGLGGLALAAPGVFAPAADTPPAPAPVVEPATVEAEVDSVDENVARHTTDADVTCAEGNHGETVSSVARAEGDVTAAAESQCGKPVQSGTDDGEQDDDAAEAGVERHTTDPDGFPCADGNHGQTVSSVAEAGGDVTAAAHSQCGKPIHSGGSKAANQGVERHTTDLDGFPCAEGNHGQTVSSVARAGGDVTAAAESQCGMPIHSGGDDTDDTDESEESDESDDSDAGNRPGPNQRANERAHERAGRPGNGG